MTEGDAPVFVLPPLPPHLCPQPCECVDCIAYLRVSQIGKRKRVISPELQMHEIVTAATAAGRRIVDVIPDINQSGTKFASRRIVETTEAIKRGEYREVWAWKWSRIGRNTRESLNYIHAIEDAGGKVEAATERFDTTKGIGRLGRGMQLQFAEFQADLIGEGYKETHEHRRRAGLPHTSAPRFGYRYKPGTGYEIHKAEADPLKKAYEDVTAGKSFRSISLDWNARGFRTTVGGLWTPESLARHLDAGFAAGKIRERSNPKRNAPRNSRKAFDVWRDGTHASIIDSDLWADYQAKRDLAAQTPPRLRVATYALSGMLYCGEPSCNARLVAGKSGADRRHIWYCPNVRTKKAHKALSIDNANALKIVLGWVESEAGKGESVTVEAERIAKQGAACSEIETLEGRRSVLAAQRQRVLDMAERNMIEMDEAESRTKAIALDIAAADAALRAAKLAQSANGEGLVRAFSSLRDEWPNFEPHDHREALSALIGRIVVKPYPRGGRATLKIEPVWEQ